jgi:hypothetical protein
LLAETLTRAYTLDSAERETSVIEEEKGAVALELNMFYTIRKPRVAATVDRGRKLDRNKTTIGVVAEYSMHLLFVGDDSLPIYC